MPSSQASRTVLVSNPEGLHARAALLVRELALRFAANVEVIKGPMRVDATDVLQMLSLCAMEGEELVVEARGEQADAAVEAVAQLFARKFDADGPQMRHET